MNLWLQELAQTTEQLNTRASLLEALDILEDQLQTLDDAEQETARQLLAELNRRLDAMPG